LYTELHVFSVILGHSQVLFILLKARLVWSRFWLPWAQSHRSKRNRTCSLSRCEL